MNNANLYAKSNDYQRHFIKKLLDEFAPTFQCQIDDGDSVLDIGSGTGDATVELILPLLPANFRHLVGCDISDNMIDYAQQKHSNHPKVFFDRLDIGDKDSRRVAQFLDKFGSFKRVLSFFCLHWVPDQRTAMENIFKLLTPIGGDCLLLILSSAQLFNVYMEMSASSKWSKFMHDAELYISPYHWMDNPADGLRSLLQKVGFASSNVRIQNEIYSCKNIEELENIVRSMNPFVDRIPVCEQKDFIEETIMRIVAKNKELRKENRVMLIDLAVVYAKK